MIDGDTWGQFGKSISEGLSDALDYTASYIPEAYDSISESIKETVEDLEENADNYVKNASSWNWWDQQVKEGVDRMVRKIDSNFDDAKEFLDESTDSIAKLIKYKSAILRLPKQISRGDAEFYMVLELIADHDSALTYFTYLDLFIEAVPPNFMHMLVAKQVSIF